MKSNMLILAALATGLAVSTPASAAGDPEKGKQVFAQCAACHKADTSGKSMIGPNLWGVFGRTSGTSPGFHYSPAMVAAKRTWTEAALDAYLAAPMTAVPGNRMPFAGVKDATARRNLVAYLKTLK